MENIEQTIIRSAKVVGTKQVLRGISEGTVRCVIVAEDADRSLLETIRQAADRNAVDIVSVATKAELGNMAGVEVATAAVGLID